MTETATLEPDSDGAAEGLDREYAAEVLNSPATWPARDAASVRLRQAEFSAGLRAELDFAKNMRELGQRYLVTYPLVRPKPLVWRLIAAVSIAVGIAAAGLVLTVIALTGAPFTPNVYVALAVLFVGISLCATVVTAVNGTFPRPRRR